MRHRALFVIFISGVAAVILTASQGGDLPDGKGKDVLQRMCTNCHGLDQVTANRYSKKYWGSVVDDMVSRGAEGSDQDINAVISYLSRNFGKPVNVNTATAKEIETGLSFTAAESELVVKYRTEKRAFKSYEELVKVPGLNGDLLEEQKKNIVF
jgi:competence ComEA-like helix-hairpin-helix protein